ncbi:MAG: hypothetical protein COV08_00915 [Candidatus Vogelbacteria bacterium CG10_big_fil_rev_8_21_14_0_10_49_38]|uniref:UDP-N-acetylmuramoyl-L-alanyl-D-glutamate--2, 6-diaminopimelate ligase n=1 Tax=Candidatus Vogelbacteria bacterium CG10_big_fil_rev_8_21_14_0_10_49_38 TaxID=1975043 RepID=A0A2H0RIJ6_9BACT|nr:MAG: hypothetical protein BK006_00920 [bacterium CG10_49_38]PIR46236.1 MAG: hypothetical protein COV08_00915 [Candidatus Vogelbacteria bacterium CG10_big_fil_rev_8_21_14_0_10_49_38]
MKPNDLLEASLRQLKKLIPRNLFRYLQPSYHYFLAWLGAVIYRFPSRQIKVLTVTGTKGKTSTTEILTAMLQTAGFKVASTSTLQFTLAGSTKPNLYKMSMPGRMFLQRFLRQAVKIGCDYAVLESASEGVKLFRHKFIRLNGLVFTNLSPEHLESHGSYENYLAAKLEYAKALAHSPKTDKIIVVNDDDQEATKFLALAPTARPLKFSLTDAEPYQIEQDHLTLTWRGETIKTPLVGRFNLYNLLAAATMAEAQGVTAETIKKTLTALPPIKGRLEKIVSGGPEQDFEVIVDYAHTVDSLAQAYEALGRRGLICVLGGTGGGRDRDKRSQMGAIADQRCKLIFITNEDPYDEDPEQIMNDVATGVRTKNYRLVADRRLAIRQAMEAAKTGDVVMITGKGTDPYIMGQDGKKTPWSDAVVAREEILKILTKRQNARTAGS